MIKSYTMKQVVLAAAAIGGLALAATPSSGSPPAPALIGASSAIPEATSGVLEKAYYKRHKKHSYYRHKKHYYYAHRRHHRRYYAYDYGYPDYYAYDDCYDYYDGCGYPYRRYGYPLFPFIGFGFGFGGHHHHHHHW